MPGETSNNRVTTQQFYEAQLKTNEAISNLKDSQNDKIGNMERRIVDRLDTISECLPKMENQVATNKDEINRLRLNSNVKDVAIAVGAAIGTAVAAVIGSKQ